MKKIVAIGITAALLLTGCAGNKESSFDSVSESALPTTELTEEPDIITAGEETEGADLEVEPGYQYPPTPHLLYNGEIYSYHIGSQNTEVDGKLYELMENEIIEPFIDAEKMKAECEYIGQSVPISVDVLPENELELASYFKVPCDLYIIDENQILVYCAEEYDVPERFKGTMFYPGTYRFCSIYTKALDGAAQTELIRKYYRYDERFPEDNGNDTEDESAGTPLPEEKVASIVTIPSTFSAEDYEPSFETDDAIIEPLFELDGSEYIWDEPNFGYDFIVDENGDMLIVTYNVGEEPVEISEYARSIKEEQGWEPPEILDALQEIDALEYLGRAEFIEDKANAFEYHNSYLFRYKDKVLLIEPPSDHGEVYTSTMFKPC